MDFGLARMSGSDMTSTGMVMGTPHYMSPEQVRGAKADARSDVFALGCVLYELLTGRKPFDAESMHAVLFKVLQEEPSPVRCRSPPACPRPSCRSSTRRSGQGPGRAIPVGERDAGRDPPRAAGGRRGAAATSARPTSTGRSPLRGAGPPDGGGAARPRAGAVHVPPAAAREPVAAPDRARRSRFVAVLRRHLGPARLGARPPRPPTPPPPEVSQPRAAGDRLAGRARPPQARHGRLRRGRAPGGAAP